MNKLEIYHLKQAKLIFLPLVLICHEGIVTTKSLANCEDHKLVALAHGWAVLPRLIDLCLQKKICYSCCSNG